MDRKKSSASRPQRQRKNWRPYAIAAVIIVVLPLAAGGIWLSQFNPNAYAPEIIKAVQKATGRTLTINGAIRLKLSLTPTLVADGLTLSNPSDFADPALLTLSQIQAQIALLPLLHHQLDILDLKLIEPKLYLERNASGQADWVLTPQHPTPAAPAAPAARSAYKIAVEAVSLENGQIILRAQDNTPPTTITITSLTGQADSLNAPLHIAGQAGIGTTPLALHGVVGPVADLTSAHPTPWPLNLTFGFANAVATLQGEIAQPQSMHGYKLHFSTQIPALEDLRAALPPAWLQGINLPALHDLNIAFAVQDSPQAVPDFTNITINAGASDLSSLWPGFKVSVLSASAPDLSAPGTFSLKGTIGQLPLLMQAQWSSLSDFLPPPWHAPGEPENSMTANATVNLGTASATLRGGFATPQTFSGAAWALTMNVPDLSALSAAWGAPLPAWKAITLQTTLTDSGGQGLLKAVTVNTLTASMDNASFGGHANLVFGPRPDLTLTLAIATADLDALQAALPPSNSPTTANASAAPPAAHLGQAVASSSLPLNLLRHVDATISLSADHLIYKQANYTALQADAVLKNGLLTINPFSVELPGGAVSASGSLDASVEPAAETLHVNAPALALSPLLHGFDLPDDAQGTMQIQMNLSSRGDSFPAMLKDVSGQFGLASVNAEIDGQAIARVLGRALQTVGLPAQLVGAPGPVPLRCAAMRLDAQDGTGTLRALTFDSSRLLLVGGGTMNFATQTLGLVLTPHLRVSSTNLVVPIKVGGTFKNVTYSVAPQSAILAAGQALAGVAGSAVPQSLTSNTLLGSVVRTLTGNDQKDDSCSAALQLARMGQSGPAPRALPSGTSAPVQLPLNSPRSLLNALLSQ